MRQALIERAMLMTSMPHIGRPLRFVLPHQGKTCRARSCPKPAGYAARGGRAQERRIISCEAVLRDGQGRVLAHGTSTLFVIDRRQPEG